MSLPLEVFCCSTQEDEEMLWLLKKHLRPMTNCGRITLRSQTILHTNRERVHELHQLLETASIILLFLSSDFLASDFCSGSLMKRALEREALGQAQIITVRRPKAPFATFPTTWSNEENVLRSITQQIHRILLGRTLRPVSKPFPIEKASDSFSLASRTDLAPPTWRLSERPKAIRVWCTLTGHTEPVSSVSLSADGSLLVSGGSDQTLRLWHPRTGQLLRLFPPAPYPVSQVALSADGGLLASGNADGSIHLYHSQTGELLRRLPGESKKVPFAMSADGLILAHLTRQPSRRPWSNQQTEVICLSHAHTGQPLHLLRDQTDAVISMALSADGIRLASGDHDGTVSLWNASTGQLLCRISIQGDPPCCVALSADGRWLACGGADGMIQLYDTRTGRCSRLTGHISAVNCLAWSPDGLLFASGSYDQMIKLWEPQTGTLVWTLTGHADAVTSLAFSADGHLLASGSDDRTVKVWATKA